MPNVRDSSATIGTTRGPTVLSRKIVESERTNAIVVEISRSPVDSSSAENALRSGAGSGASTLRRRAGTEPSFAMRSRR